MNLMTSWSLAAVVAVQQMIAPQAAAACGNEDPCQVASGTYHIARPEAAEALVPAVIWIHGFGSSGAGILRNAGVSGEILSRGYALIAPNGLKRQSGQGGSWSFHPNHPRMPPRRDEIAFLTQVREDAIQKHGLDPDRVLLAGFSIGGSMTSYLACAAPETFTAYAPLAGAFWRPHPTRCKAPVKLRLVHGWADGTVPLEGRVLRGDDVRDPDMLAQGDVFHSLDIWRQTNECVHLKADVMETEGPLWTRRWTRCAEGSALEFVLFPGGHVIPDGWAADTLDWFEQVTK